MQLVYKKTKYISNKNASKTIKLQVLVRKYNDVVHPKSREVSEEKFLVFKSSKKPKTKPLASKKWLNQKNKGTLLKVS